MMFSVLVFLLALTLAGCSASLVPGDWASWEKVSQTVSIGPVPGHEEAFRTAYLNKTAEATKPAAKDGQSTWDYPKGSIILKAAYNGSAPPGKGESPARLYAMVKNPDDPRAKGGWVWVVRDGANGIESVIDAPFCVDCHGYANQPNPYGDRNPGSEFRDYVFLPYEGGS
jgi:hypothetical protein